MTKEELDRIRKAYSSGLKVQIWFNGHWEDFDIRDYSMYPEPFSENRQYRIVGSSYADIAEKRIAELEAQIEKMTNTETMLKILKDRGVIRSWYYNGTYHIGNELSKESD